MTLIASSFGGDDWESLWEYEDEYLPDRWRDLPEIAADTGRDAGDDLVFQSFVDAPVAGEQPPIEVH